MRSWRATAIAFLTLSLIMGTAARAEDDPAAKDTGPWSGNVSLGFLSSSGNTDDSSTTFAFLVGYATGAWNHSLDGKAYGASSTNGDTGVNQTTAESYQLGWKSTYDLDARNYVFGKLDWNKDRFASYVEQTYETVGYGRRILDNETYTLNVEVGAGFAQQELAPPCVPIGDCDQDGAVGIFGGEFLWNINENVTFGQDLGVFVASDNTYWETVTSIRAGLIGNVGLVASYTVKANTDAPIGKDKRDTYTAISLDYLF
jgi:putative salt-induced outer membrane protein